MPLGQSIGRRFVSPFRRATGANSLLEWTQSIKQTVEQTRAEVQHATALAQGARDLAEQNQRLSAENHQFAAHANALVEHIRKLVEETNSLALATHHFAGLAAESPDMSRAVGRDLGNELRAATEAARDMNGLVISRLNELRSELDTARDQLAAGQQELAGLVGRPALPPIGVRLADINGPTADFLNYVGSHRGPLQDAKLWINHPVVLSWQAGGAAVGAVNERIVEQPFVFAAIGTLPPGSRVIDVGGGESIVAFALASLGYRVSVVEPNGYPFAHPNLTVIADLLENVTADEPFDGAVVLSAVEHFGIGAYGGPQGGNDDDRIAMEHLRGLLRPGGLLAFTAPYGPSAVNDLERTYDDQTVTALLSGWQIESARVARRDHTAWVTESDSLVPPTPGEIRVVLATARVPVPAHAPAPDQVPNARRARGGAGRPPRSQDQG